MRIQETNQILNESKILRNANKGEMKPRGWRSSLRAIPGVLRDRRVQGWLVAGVIGVVGAMTLKNRTRDFVFRF